jgi:hypothetical protein
VLIYQSIENKKRIGRRFILEQLEKCDKKIAEGDYDGAITNARSLVEDVIARDIYKQATGKELKTKGDLVDDYKLHTQNFLEQEFEKIKKLKKKVIPVSIYDFEALEKLKKVLV